MPKKPAKGRRTGRSLSESYPLESTVGDQPARKAGSAPSPSPAGEVPSREALREKIAVKAYELFERRGQVHGHDLDDWLEAEQRVVSERRADAGREKNG